MRELEQRIAQEGRALSEQVLLVDSFLNHQVDVALMERVGEEFARLFADRGVTRVATIEASGIAPAAMTALKMGVPLVIMKKSASAILQEGICAAKVHSFTKNTDYTLICKRQFLPAGERILFIDDFLANGEAALGAASLIESAGASVAGIGIVIEKSFQNGSKRLARAGYTVHSLARIARMRKGEIAFA